MLERDTELEALDKALDEAGEGSGRFLLIEGPPGIGKSTLLGAACGRARESGFTVLNAVCDPLETAFPFGVAIQLVEPAVTDPASDLFEGPAQLAAGLFGAESAQGGALADDASFARIHGLTWLCANLAARSPLLLAVDDAQWADEPSLGWLLYLARRLEGVRLLVAVAARTGEPEAGEEVLRRLRATPDPCVLRPAPLSESAARRMSEDMLGADASDELSRACHRASAGNPFFLGELLTELAKQPASELAARVDELVPESVSRAVTDRLLRLEPAAVAAARAIAILGDPGSLRQVTEVAGLDTDAAARATDALAASGLVGSELPPRFVHPLVRDSVHAEIAPGERALLHSAAAEALHGDGAKPELVAAHLLDCEPSGRPWAVAALRESARHALGNGAPAAAARYLRRAIDEGDTQTSRTELLFELGQAQIDAGDPACAETLEQATSGGADAGSLRELGRALSVFGRFAEAADAFDRASAAAGDEQPDLRLEIEAELASIQLTLRGGADVSERLARHRENLTGASGGERLLMAVAAFADAHANGPTGPSADLAAQALRGWREQDLRSASLCFYEGVFTLIYGDRYEEADAFLDEALRDARARGSPTAVITASWLRAWCHLRCGRLADAEAEATSAPDRSGDDAGASGPLLRAVLIEALVERGELDRAEEALGADAHGELPSFFVFNPLLYSRGVLRLARGQVEEGVHDVLAAGRGEDGAADITPAAFPWKSVAALGKLAGGSGEEASRLAAEELEMARAGGAPRAVGVALRTMGVIEGPDGIGKLREAAETLESSGARLEYARACLELGAALRRAGTPKQARDPLRLAVDEAERCGARPVAERAHEELVASGAKPRRRALSGRDALTPSELRVAKLAAEGRNNREIAQDLFVTVRTVEGHLSHAYTKLGISSREALPEALDSPV